MTWYNEIILSRETETCFLEENIMEAYDERI